MPVSFSPFASGETPTVEQLLGPLYTPEMRAAFPDVKPPYSPFGYLVLVQLKLPPKKSGSILLADDSIDTERHRSQAALVRSFGVSCFKDRQTGEQWIEGPWFKVGDFIRCPMYGGDRFYADAKIDGKVEKVCFAFFKEADAIALVTGDPLTLQTS
jgi:hypothetical protein